MYCASCGAPLSSSSGRCPECSVDIAHQGVIELAGQDHREGRAKVLALTIAAVGLALAYLEPNVLTLDPDVEQELADGIGALTLLLSLLAYARRSSVVGALREHEDDPSH